MNGHTVDIMDRFIGEEQRVRRTPYAQPKPEAPTDDLPRLGSMLAPALEQAKRRAERVEKPIALPWRSLDPHFGGGLWPGLHILTSTSGVGKTQGSLQIAISAASAGVPVAYIGLELSEIEIALRTLGLSSRVPWSTMWTGNAGPTYIRAAEAAVSKLDTLPIHPFFGGPSGFSVDRIGEIGRTLRAHYPEDNGPGSRPILLIIDFLQLVDAPAGERLETREKVGRTAYACRELARTMGFAILAISSVGRSNYGMGDLAGKALGFDLDDDGRPINRVVRAPEMLMGVAKESGDVEFSADSVSVMFRVPGTERDHGVDVVFATAKGRATGARWSPLHFTGFQYDECDDGGAAIVDAWKSASEKRTADKQAKRDAREQAKADRVVTDAANVATFVLSNPGCTARDARRAAVGDDSRRWKDATSLLGPALDGLGAGRKASKLAIVPELLAEDIRGRMPGGVS